MAGSEQIFNPGEVRSGANLFNSPDAKLLKGSPESCESAQRVFANLKICNTAVDSRHTLAAGIALNSNQQTSGALLSTADDNMGLYSNSANHNFLARIAASPMNRGFRFDTTPDHSP
jgi:hypothetical protein